MSRSLSVNAAAFADGAKWMAKLRGTDAVQVSAAFGALQLRRSDFEQFRESVIPAEGAGQAAVTVDAAKLATLLKGATGSAVVDVGDSELSIGLSGRTVRLRGVDVEFPAWPDFEPTDRPAVLGAGQLARVLTSVGGDEAIPALTGVAFDDGAMVATDRFRLTRILYADSGFTALVPGDALRAFAGGTDVVTVEPGKTMMRLSSGGRSIVVGKLDHEFPKWRKLIPGHGESPVNMLLRRDDLILAAEGEFVTLTADGDTMTVCSTDRDGDVEVEQKVSVSVVRGDGLPLTVKMMTKYLTGCLRSISCGAVRLEASAPDKPVMFTDVGGTDLHLVMPIRP